MKPGVRSWGGTTVRFRLGGLCCAAVGGFGSAPEQTSTLGGPRSKVDRIQDGREADLVGHGSRRGHVGRSSSRTAREPVRLDLGYHRRWPNPAPEVFGFHEVFHTFTILAFVAHYVGISMATYALR